MLLAACASPAPNETHTQRATAPQHDAALRRESAPAKTPEELTRSRRIASWLIQRREVWSDDLVGVARGVDRFFGGEEADVQENGTYLRLSVAEIFQKSGNHVLDTRFKLKIDLPGTEHRWKLVLESDDNDGAELSENATAVPSDNVSITSDNGAVGAFRYALTEYRHWKFDADLGVRTPLPLDPFVRLRARRDARLSPEWTLRVRQELYQYRRQGFVSVARVLFDRPITTSYFFRNQLQAQFRDESNLWEFDERFSTLHVLDERNAIDYAIGVVGQNRPNPRVMTYYITSKYRRLLYQEWFYVELQPTLAFPREQNFSLTPSFTLRFQVAFSES